MVSVSGEHIPVPKPLMVVTLNRKPTLIQPIRKRGFPLLHYHRFAGRGFCARFSGCARPHSPRSHDALLACRSRQGGKSIESLCAGFRLSRSSRPEIGRPKAGAGFAPVSSHLNSARAYISKTCGGTRFNLSTNIPQRLGNPNHPQALKPMVFSHLSSATQPKMACL